MSVLEDKANETMIKQQKDKKNLMDNLSNQNFIIFPNVDRIPSEKIYEAYSKLYESYKKLYTDKEIALSSLKAEILNNDQQRNYIEILKRTIESSLVKTGLKPMIENSATQSGKDFYNTVIEISSLHNEMEKIKSDNTALEVINAKLKNEVDYLNKSNTNFKEKIQDSLESGIKELEEAKGKIRILENEKENLLTQLNEANEYNERLKQAIQKFEEENTETSNKVVKIQKNYEDKMKEQLDKITSLKEENSKLNQLKNELIKNNENLKESKKMLNEKIEQLQKENEKSTKEIKNIKEINEQLVQDKMTKENNLQQINKDLMIEVKKLKSDLMQTQEGNSKINKDFMKLQSDLQNSNKKIKDFEQLLKDKEEKEKTISNETSQYLKISIYKCLNACNAFLTFCKNNKNVQKDNSSLIQLIEQVNSISSKFDQCYQTISSGKVFNDFENMIKEIKSYKTDNKKLYEQYKNLLEENSKNFYLNKENKFYIKLITRVLKYHIKNIDIKNILNQIVSINDNAICLEIDKNKIEAKIDSLPNNQQNQNEILKSKSLVNDIDNQIKDKFNQLKALDAQLKQFEKTHY